MEEKNVDPLPLRGGAGRPRWPDAPSPLSVFWSGPVWGDFVTQTAARGGIEQSDRPRFVT